MDQVVLWTLGYPIIVGLVGATISAIVLWLVIRSAVLSALRRHARDTEPTGRRVAVYPARSVPLRAGPGPRDW